ncbi:hypothetical protein K458DRAFT_32575 [Lentithecium fluviatile CBS 122367]|uniref:Uncharacterized protein n=1 Tax=Lentithecium fluviatile CBS 122367 TaxID=1168545 RepID=A0A6G1J2W8_9PLEO|nr:hypothetical protein K458DRAFT_32575 [Lentithecium fluviatile CBS 122367]
MVRWRTKQRRQRDNGEHSVDRPLTGHVCVHKPRRSASSGVGQSDRLGLLAGRSGRFLDGAFLLDLVHSVVAKTGGILRVHTAAAALTSIRRTRTGRRLALAGPHPRTERVLHSLSCVLRWRLRRMPNCSAQRSARRTLTLWRRRPADSPSLSALSAPAHPDPAAQQASWLARNSVCFRLRSCMRS